MAAPAGRTDRIAELDERQSSDARRELIAVLQMAYSGERAAAYAYLGHRKSLLGRRRAEDRALLTRVLIEEIQHRRTVRKMLRDLGAGPDPRREARMGRLGKVIGAACLVSGWFAPMYGAGRLESQNVIEYEIAARLAHRAGLEQLAGSLLALAEVEWDHEYAFRSRAESHWLWRVSPKWTSPPPRERITASYAEFIDSDDAVPSLSWTPLR